jgi:hypothetical protein
MRNSIDRLINKVLEEEIQNKVRRFLNEDKDEWMEIDGTIDEMDIDEDENLESREFVYAARKAKEQGKKTFELDGKKFDVKEKMEKLHHSLENVSESKLHEYRNNLISKKYPTIKDRKMLETVESALRLKKLNNKSRKLRFTETELIDLIESLILEKKTDNKRPRNLEEQELESFIRKIVQNRIDEVTDLDNMDKKIPFGLSKTQKVQRETKKENDDYSKEVVKKMKEYLKDGSKGGYSENPDSFPKGNGEMGEMDRKAYKASDAVEEYIQAFAYPGLENTHYDEIHPQEEWVKKNIVGSSETGNNPKWANAVDTGLGERINKKREENLYQKEKDRSYKRVSQPVDRAGENKGDKKLDDIFTKLESVENKKQKLVNEEMNKMKNLINYNQKTQ